MKLLPKLERWQEAEGEASSAPQLGRGRGQGARVDASWFTLSLSRIFTSYSSVTR